MTFYVGQPILCVDDDLRGRSPFYGTPDFKRVQITMPVKGRRYTVRDIENDGLRVEEIINPIGMSLLDGILEPTYTANRFAPIEEKKTDISVFTEILDRENAKPRDKVRA